MEIQRALQEPHNATVDILAVVDASDRTPSYPNEIWEVALMDDRHVLNMVFDGDKFTYFQYQYFGTLFSGMAFLRIMLPDP
jgi:hypothetical protein